MSLETTLIRRVILLGAFALCAFAVSTRLAAAQTPSLKLLVINTGIAGEQAKHDRSLVIVDPLTRKVVGRVPIDYGHPHEVVASPDGKFAFVSCVSTLPTNPDRPVEIRDSKVPRKDFISVIDLATRKEVRRVEFWPNSQLHDLAFSAGKVWFSLEGYKLVGSYDPASNQIDWMQGHGGFRSHELAVNKDGTKVFTATTGSDSIVAIELFDPPADFDTGHAPPKLWKVTNIPVGKQPEGIALSPDGKEVWTINRVDGSVSIIDVATHKTATLNLHTEDPLRLAFTLDGKRVVIVTDTTQEALILDAVSRKEIKRIGNLGEILHGVLMSPDGKRAYISAKGPFLEHTPKDVAIINLDTLELEGHIDTGERAEGMAWAVTK